MPQKIFLGIDVGSAHLKVVSLGEKENFEIYRVGEIAFKLKMESRRLELIFPLLRKIISEKSKEGKVYVNLVTSIDVAYPEKDYLLEMQRFAEECEANFFMLSENLIPVEIKKMESWIFLSSVNSLRYVAQKYLKNGILIQMNANSALFIPVKNGCAPPLEIHYSSGIGMWAGALYRHVFNITGTGVYVLGEKTYVSPISPIVGSIIDILFQISPQKAEKMLKMHNATAEEIEELRNLSQKRLMQLLGFFPNKEYRNFRYGGFFSKENQIKVASYHIYSNFLQALLENTLKILSSVDIEMNNMEIGISGIGEPILEDALHLFHNRLIKFSDKLSPPKSIMLEAYGAALSLKEYIEGKRNEVV